MNPDTFFKVFFVADRRKQKYCVVVYLDDDVRSEFGTEMCNMLFHAKEDVIAS